MIDLSNLHGGLDFLMARLEASHQIGLVTLSSDLRIIDCSQGFAHLIEQSKTLHGIDLLTLLLPESRGVFVGEFAEKSPLQLHFALAASDCVTLLCSFHQTADGYLMYAEQARMADSEVIRTMSLLNNEMAGLTRELNRKNRSLLEMQYKLQAKNNEIVEFGAIVAHDFNSPLITINSFLELLKKDIAADNRDRIQKDMAYITSAAAKLTQLLDALHQVTRIGTTGNPAATISFSDLIQTCLTSLAGPLQQQGIEVVVNDSDLRLTGDQLQLGQIWQNLIENAVKYRGDQPAPRIVLGVDTDQQQPEFYVRDNGMGIEPKHAQRIFGLFAQLDPMSDGRGLGLALIKRLVELYQGTIRVESEGSGRGSCFKFTLPGAIKHK